MHGDNDLGNFFIIYYQFDSHSYFIYSHTCVLVNFVALIRCHKQKNSQESVSQLLVSES